MALFLSIVHYHFRDEANLLFSNVDYLQDSQPFETVAVWFTEIQTLLSSNPSR